MKKDQFRDQIAEQLRAAGREVRKEVVHFKPFGKRVIDIEVRINGVAVGGIEIKNGNSRYTPSQRAKDEWIAMHICPINLVRQK